MRKYLNPLFCSFILALAASCVGNPGSEEILCPEEGGSSPGDGKLELAVSNTTIKNDGVEEAEFTVMKGKSDVTSDARIYQKKDGSHELLSSPSFSSTVAGEYVFYATYNNEKSDDVAVLVAPELQDLPEDPEPDRYEGFKQRVLAVQGTGLGCVYCPLMIAGLTEYAKTEESRSTVLVADHISMGPDKMINDYSTAVGRAMGFSGIPALLFNMRTSGEIIGTYGGDTPASVAKRIQTAAQTLLKNGANTAISAAVSGSESSGTITVDAAVKVGKAGKYRICAWVLEDDIFATGQKSIYPQLADEYDFTRHNNVLRCISSTSPVSGADLGGKTECQAGETLMFSHQFDLKDMDYEKLSNVRVAVIVCRNESGSRYTVDNVVSCGLNKQTAFEYE